MSRSPHLFLPPLVLDRQSRAPLHRQLSDQLARAIRCRATDGQRLPSSRMLARLLGVSRNTVLTAYDELVARGMVNGRRGAAMLVDAAPLTALPDPGRLLREAQYPARTLDIGDPDGSPLYLNYSR